MLDVIDVDAGYGELQVLHGVTLSVGEREVVSLVGPNGAGKTTLLRAILGLVPARRGRILFRGARLDGLPPEQIVRRGIAVVPEGARVFADMSVLDNLKLGALTRRARARRDESLATMFAMFPRLQERAGQPARTLSGGERQMLAIGRALMALPELLLLDEPSLGLAPALVRAMIETVQRISEGGVTVFLVEQNIHISLPISQRGYVLERGRVVMEDAGPALLDNPHVRVSYLGV